MSPTLDKSTAAHFTQLLARREQELRAMLGNALPHASDAAGHDVSDFKDAAVEESQAMVDDAQADHAARELEQVLAAQRRVHDGSFGECVECGEQIDPRRLEAIPFTPYCTSCQSRHEHVR